MRWLTCLGLWLVIAGRLHASEEWILTTADLRTERVSLRAVSEQGISLVGGDGRARTVDFDQMLQIERGAPAHAGGGRFMLYLDGAEQVCGEPRGLRGEVLVWSNPALGELQLPMTRVLGISRGPRPSPLSEKRPSDDMITLANGDTVRGIIAAITDLKMAIHAGGDLLELPLDSIVEVEFAPVAALPASSETTRRAFRVGFADATAVMAGSMRSEDQRLRLELLDGTTCTVPMSLVTSIEQINGPLVWLSSRRPLENVHVPFLDLSSPARMNRSVTGGPIRFGQRTYARGIGVHSYSRLVWEIDPQYRAFRTQYAIDGALPHADVVVRIWLDDRIVHERKDVRAGMLCGLILLDTAGARTLTLEVDYGESYDVQDRLNWIEPALLKQKPAPPTTIPTPQPPTTNPQ